MKHDIAELWAVALESGQYTQGKYYLFIPEQNCFCPMGVLCDLYLKQTGTGGWEGRFFNDGASRGVTSIPGIVMRWSGIQSKIGRYADEFKEGSIMGDNDVERLTFKEIAAKIRHYKSVL